MHKFAKQIADCLKAKVEGMGIDNINGADLEELKAWSEIIKNIVCYDKDYKIIEEMDKEKEEDEKDEKHFLKMLKEEYGMEEEDARRFYRGQPRSRTSGRFMSRGDGRRNNSGRRGYEEAFIPMDYRMDMEDYTAYPPEYWRDVDRHLGRMYYTDGGSGGGQSGNSGGMGGSSMGGSQSGGGNSGGNVRGYSDGYSDGYREGERSGRSSNGRRDGREGRSGQSRRSYMESKEMNKGNSPQEKQEKMKELEKYMGELGSDITEMISDASPEERALLKQKMQVLVQKLG